MMKRPHNQSFKPSGNSLTLKFKRLYAGGLILSFGGKNMKWKYQLVLQFPFSGLTDYDAMIVLEEALIAELANKALMGGHDAGSGEMNIFIHTNDPRRLFKKILSSHGSDPMFSRMKAAYRVFESDNYMVLWPKGFKRRFTVK